MTPRWASTVATFALLVGARPRGPGMERADLLAANGGIFGPQGAAIAANAAAGVRVTVVGNPANTNALIAAACGRRCACGALHRADAAGREPRAGPSSHTHSALPCTPFAACPSGAITRRTQFPDISHATVGGRPVAEALEQIVGDVPAWLDQTFIPRVAKRGAEIIEVRGSSSVASAASATIDHVRDWVQGTDDWTSAGVVSHGEYGVPEGLISSFPVRSVDGEWQIVDGLEVSDWARTRIDASVAELLQERETVQALGLL